MKWSIDDHFHWLWHCEKDGVSFMFDDKSNNTTMILKSGDKGMAFNIDDDVRPRIEKMYDDEGMLAIIDLFIKGDNIKETEEETKRNEIINRLSGI